MYMSHDRNWAHHAVVSDRGMYSITVKRISCIYGNDLELSLGSGGEYDVHLLVQVKTEAKYPFGPMQRLSGTFEAICALKNFMELQLYGVYPDAYALSRDIRHICAGSWDYLLMDHIVDCKCYATFCLQAPWVWFLFALEIDIRILGTLQPYSQRLIHGRKHNPQRFWERSSRFYVPSVTAPGKTLSRWSASRLRWGPIAKQHVVGLNGAKTAWSSKADNPIWGPRGLMMRRWF